MQGPSIVIVLNGTVIYRAKNQHFVPREGDRVFIDKQMYRVDQIAYDIDRQHIIATVENMR